MLWLFKPNSFWNVIKNLTLPARGSLIKMFQFGHYSNFAEKYEEILTFHFFIAILRVHFLLLILWSWSQWCHKKICLIAYCSPFKFALQISYDNRNVKGQYAREYWPWRFFPPQIMVIFLTQIMLRENKRLSTSTPERCSTEEDHKAAVSNRFWALQTKK